MKFRLDACSGTTLESGAGIHGTSRAGSTSSLGSPAQKPQTTSQLEARGAMPAVSPRRKGVQPLSHRLSESSNSRVTDHRCGPQNAVTRRGNLRLPASGTHGITKSAPALITKAVSWSDMATGLGNSHRRRQESDGGQYMSVSVTLGRYSKSAEHCVLPQPRRAQSGMPPICLTWSQLVCQSQ